MNENNRMSYTLMTDQEIINRVLKGQKDLYKIIVRRYRQQLYGKAKTILNSRAEIEELIQVTYIKAYEHLNQFSGKSTFGTWLTRILINEALLMVKLKKRKLLLPAESISEILTMDKRTDFRNPLKKLVNRELRTILNQAISQLPKKYLDVFIMREIEALNVAETQECLHISATNVKVRLTRAKQLLRKAISTELKKQGEIGFVFYCLLLNQWVRLMHAIPPSAFRVVFAEYSV